MGRTVSASLVIRSFTERDAFRVRELFVTVNRQLSPPDMREVFEAYISRSLVEEIDRITDYYRERGGGFWVATRGHRMIGMFGLERGTRGSFEVLRMYVDPSA
jgi:putative acetyltransferase